MAKKKKNIVPDKKFFEDLGNEVRDKIVATGQSGKGIGGGFKPYKRAYELRKSQGKASPRGVAQVSTKTSPDLTLTGSMWNNLSSRAKDDSVQVGWTATNEAMKVQGNADRGRAVFTKDAIAQPVEDLINEMYQKEMKKKTKKLKQKPVVLKMGKK